MKHAIIIFCFTLSVTLFYNYVGHMVPQKEVHPPKEVSIGSSMTVDQMVEAGKSIFEGKGTCLSCHNGNARFPVLDTVGSVAASRISGYSDIDYLAESLYEPNKFIVPSFATGMPPVNKPPIGLSDQEILVVIAYLQSKGGTTTISMDTKLKYAGSVGQTASTPPAPTETGADLTGEAIFTKYGCAGCHSINSPEKILGPSLYDAGKRLTKAQLYEAVMEPDATISEGFAPGLMVAMLDGTGFYTQLSAAQVKKLIEYLSGLKG